MIQFFRQNNFLTTALLIPYTFIVRIAFLFTEHSGINESNTGILYKLLRQSIGEKIIVEYLFSVIVISFSAILVSRVVIKHRLSRFSTLLPGIIYILLSTWVEHFLPFSAVHLANFFIITALLSILKFPKSINKSLAVFDCGFFIGFASLIFPAYIILIIPATLGLAYLDRFRIKDFVTTILGLAVPYINMAAFLYFFQSQSHVFEGFSMYNIIKTLQASTANFTWLFLLYLLMIVISIVGYPQLVKKNNILIQKRIDVIYWFYLGTLGCLFFFDAIGFEYFLILCAPLSIILGMLLERVKALVLEEFLHFIFICLLFFLHFSGTTI